MRERNANKFYKRVLTPCIHVCITIQVYGTQWEHIGSYNDPAVHLHMEQ